MFQNSASHIFYPWRNDSLNMTENGQLAVHAQVWQILIVHYLKTPKDIELKFSVC